MKIIATFIVFSFLNLLIRDLIELYTLVTKIRKQVDRLTIY